MVFVLLTRLFYIIRYKVDVTVGDTIVFLESPGEIGRVGGSAMKFLFGISTLPEVALI